MAIRIDSLIHTLPTRAQDEFRDCTAKGTSSALVQVLRPLNDALVSRADRIQGLETTCSELRTKLEKAEKALRDLMDFEARGRVMPVGPAWDAARAAIKGDSHE